MEKSIKDSQHGTTTGYRYGCRCEACKVAFRIYRRNYVKTPHGFAAKTRAMRKWQQSDEGKLDQRRRDLLLKYNMTLEEYSELSTKQGHVCAICKEPCATGMNLAVDHCHQSKKTRGLLCGHCNTGLGKFKDNPRLLQQAINYLER